MRQRKTILVAALLATLGGTAPSPVKAQDFGCATPARTALPEAASDRAGLIAAEKAFAESRTAEIAYLRCLLDYAEANLDDLSDEQRDRLSELYRSQVAAIRKNAVDWNASYRQAIDGQGVDNR